MKPVSSENAAKHFQTGRIEADYIIETPVDPGAALDAMAGEQSSGTFVPVPGETQELKERSAARVERCSIVGKNRAPSLPGAASPSDTYTTATATLSWPLANMGPSLPNLVAAVAGNLFELKQFSGLRITDIRLPAEFSQAYEGPSFGVEGTRRLASVFGRPLIGTIIKPSVGLDPSATADLAATLIDAGIDFIKDDELQSDGPACPFADRARAVMKVINDYADRTSSETHVRIQHHRRFGSDAKTPRFGARIGRHLHHGQPQFSRACRNDRNLPAFAASGPRAPKRLGIFVEASDARLVLQGLAEALALGGGRSYACQRPLRTNSANRTRASSSPRKRAWSRCSSICPALQCRYSRPVKPRDRCLKHTPS